MSTPTADLGGRTPEELETLLEDAFLLRDEEAVARLVLPGGVLVGDLDPVLLAGRRRIVQAGDIALLLGEGASGVMRRGPDLSWRYAVCVLHGAHRNGDRSSG